MRLRSAIPRLSSSAFSRSSGSPSPAMRTFGTPRIMALLRASAWANWAGSVVETILLFGMSYAPIPWGIPQTQTMSRRLLTFAFAGLADDLLVPTNEKLRTETMAADVQTQRLIQAPRRLQ